MWAAGRGGSELLLLEELISLSGAASINRESHHGDTALTTACSRSGVQTGWKKLEGANSSERAPVFIFRKNNRSHGCKTFRDASQPTPQEPRV